MHVDGLLVPLCSATGVVPCDNVGRAFDRGEVAEVLKVSEVQAVEFCQPDGALTATHNHQLDRADQVLRGEHVVQVQPSNRGT